jgi:hypothetical protein
VLFLGFFVNLFAGGEGRLGLLIVRVLLVRGTSSDSPKSSLNDATKSSDVTTA